MRVKHARPVTVHWYLDSGSANDGFRFPANGIVFDNAAGWECSVQSNGLRFHCINKAGAGPHKYTINVVRGSSTCDPMDPWIVNE
jgi:hypothetical protein